jgi:hypothetical protein
MTRRDYIKYVQTRRAIQYNVKALVLYVYWRLVKTRWVKVSGYASIALSLQILSNATLLHSYKLGMVSIIFLVVGLILTSK